MSKLVATLTVLGLILFSTITEVHGAKVNWDSKGKPQFDKKAGKSCDKSCKQKNEFDFEDDNTSKGGN